MVAILLPGLAESAVLMRYVLVAGANNGGSDRQLLRYAVSDAENFVRVLESVGGVAEEDVFLLREPSSAGLAQALIELRDLVAETEDAGVRREVVVYYSGHADDRGLLLGDDRFSYQSLRDQIDNIQADVHITVLDACASGAITRLKGGKRRQAFLVDESSKMKGYAFITSSSEDEAAQESDRIGASYFTHYLVSGMRGAADASGDGKVTLGEAYQFAFHETLNTTAETQAGAQHPSYDTNLTGTGDVVMTDVRQMSAGLIVDKSLHGRLFIRNADQQLVAEVYKVAGRSIELGLEPGNYEIHFDQEPARFAAKVEIKDGERFNLAAENLESVTAENTVLRGGKSEKDELKSLSLGVVDRLDQPFDGLQLSAVGNRAYHSTGTQISPFFNLSEGPVTGAQFSFGINNADSRVGFGQFGALFNYAKGQVKVVQLAGIGNVTEGEMDGLQLGVVNYASRLDGLQISTLNLTQEGLGLQIGTANLASSTFQGIQVSVFNVAGPMRGVQIGLFSATLKGLMHTGTWIDETGMPYYTFTTGARWWYSYYNIGYNPYVTEEPWAYGGGMGGQTKVHDRLFFEIDAGVNTVTTEKRELHERVSTDGFTYRERPWNVHSKLRTTTGFKLAPGVWL